MPDDPNAPATPECPGVDALIEQIVREAHLPNARAQTDLRRELAAHFADAEAAGDAVARFGAPEAVAVGLRHAYRPWRSALYAAKLVAVVFVSTVIALPLQAAAHLQLTRDAPHVGEPSVGALRVGLTPWYGLAAHVSLAVILLAVVAWEFDIEPACRRLERHPARFVTVVLGLFAASLVAHAWWGLQVAPGEALVGAGATVIVWTVSLAVIAHSDRLLLRLLGGAL